ncbi:hypothetical protein AAHA92_04947 [Salvia divinorum]|uniref:Uncharacterized protein n=1 Tax=Salvia divinorum TaxID=28513 RepID=A0ABD1I4E1_SALDI
MVKTLVLIMVALLFVGAILPSSLAYGSGRHTGIDYGALEGNNYYKRHPEHNPANPYNRGCTAAEHCRGWYQLSKEQGAANMKDKFVDLLD